MNAEQQRLEEDRLGRRNWRRWGPYLSERQWGTVREDYSPHGTPWEYFPHDMARSRAYRWGEDGLCGISDDWQRLCFGIGLWNECDPFLKERLFGLTNHEGNHGEDVKECYYYLDATPTHSYLKALYKYPQQEFPYEQLRKESANRDRTQPEFELCDTGIFDDDCYFDVLVEYAKGEPDDILIRVTVTNRGPEAAAIHLLAQLWFRNTWSWTASARRPQITQAADGHLLAEHYRLGKRRFYGPAGGEVLFTENETNAARLYDQDKTGHSKDAFHDYIVEGDRMAVNPQRRGTKSALAYRLHLPAGGSTVLRFRLCDRELADPWADYDKLFAQRLAEADTFYGDMQREIPDADCRAVQRQALAGMVWNKQFYHYDVPRWLEGDPAQPAPPPERKHGRNSTWQHLNNADIISMPDKWEYPWYAAWDLAFHCIPLAMIDPEFAKSQLILLAREWYMHPNGELPAYEWSFGDANPPVHAWATWHVFQIDRKIRGGSGDIAFLERVFHKLLLNFTWWVNRKDAGGRNVFQGGFLGLDNIGVFDRSAPLPEGVKLEQADATSWMAMFSLNMMRIALELALTNPVYQDIATKFFEHFLAIAEAMGRIGEDDGHGQGLWDNEEEFFFDVLNLPDGEVVPLKIHSMVGLIPLFAVETLEPDLLARVPEFNTRLEWYLKNRPDLAALVSKWTVPGAGDRRLLALLRGHRMKCVLRRMLDEEKFLSPYGVRSMSRRHEHDPYILDCGKGLFTLNYEPGESRSVLFGGNSNWRGPIWFPVNYLIIESLQKFHHYYGDDFKIECPTGSGQYVTILEAANELSRRLTRLFLRDGRGERPALGCSEKLQRDPHFRDHVLFHEYFHGETGAGLGASHQNGWTGLVAKLLQPRRKPAEAKQDGKPEAVAAG